MCVWLRPRPGTKCGQVSSSVPHFPQVGLLPSPIVYRCLLNVLCPVSRPITTLDCKIRIRHTRLFSDAINVVSKSCISSCLAYMNIFG